METVYVMFEEWLAERYPVLDDIVKSRRMRYAITPKLADEIKEYCKDAYAAGAAFTPEAAGRSEDRWISMKDRLPADHESVLTVWHGEVQRVAYRIVRGEWIASGDECDPAPLDTFSHWRPLPALPSGAASGGTK